jgi:hypothetical protein
MTDTRDTPEAVLAGALHRWTCRDNSPHSYIQSDGYSTPRCEAAAQDPALLATLPPGWCGHEAREAEAKERRAQVEQCLVSAIRTLDKITALPPSPDEHVAIWLREVRREIYGVIGHLLLEPLVALATQEASDAD